MALRIPHRALRHCPSRFTLCVTQTRPYSSHSTKRQTAFSYSIPTGTKLSHDELFQTIREKTSSPEPSSHNAAILLATPEFSKALEDEEFMGRLVESISPSAQVGHFHILGAIVDHVAPLLGSYKPISGFSVLRGNLDDMLPQLWNPAHPPHSPRDEDALSALTFNLGTPSVTLSLARTTFLNGRSSTLLASRFDFSKGTPRLTQRSEKRSQQVTSCLSRKSPKGIADLGLFAPLVPLTPPRVVAESFGNIVRGIEIEGQKVPASTELEEAVNRLHQSGDLSGIMSGPVGVWAVVTPSQELADLSDWMRNMPDPISGRPNAQGIQDLAASTAAHLRRLYGLGGRFYKILSGGGGWGAKKGLLSLDPQRTHFALSEEEEMAGFIKSIQDSSFTPRGSRIQFFMSSPVLPDLNRLLMPAVSFGVAGEASFAEQGSSVKGFIEGHFGALSNHAIFLSESGPNDGEGTKLSVDHSRVFIAGED